VSTGMQRERLAAMRTWDLTHLGDEPPVTPPAGWRAGFLSVFDAHSTGFPLA
jgi:hypothetical protein